jgi:heme A synthase
MINVPNKEFWLAPERREQTVAFFEVQFAWFGCAFLAFLLVVNELVFAANQTSPRKLNGAGFSVALVAFLAFVGIWTVRLVVYFLRNEKTP